MKTTIHRLARYAGPSLAALLMATGAQAQQHVFNIPAQDAGKSIPEFARQAGVQISAPTDKLKGVQTAAVSGPLDTREALSRLLQGTSIVIASADGNMIVLASEASPSAAGQTQSARLAVGLEEMVVTARRREEQLQRVPVAVTAFAGKDLQAKRIETAQDLQQYVPSMAAYSFSAFRDGTSFSLRGQATILGAPASVVAYLNEVPLSETQSTNSNGGGPGLYLDLESLQVLNGPQGTLFGRNTTGGAVLFKSKMPTGQFEGYLQAGYGNYNNLQYEGVINVPLVGDKVRLRVAGQRQTRDGFTRNVVTGQDLDNRDTWAGRVTLSMRPTDAFENDLIYYATLSQSAGTSRVITFLNPAGSAAALYPGVFGLPDVGQAFAAQQARGIRDTALDGVTGETARYWSVTDIARWNITDKIVLKNIASLQSLEGLIHADTDGTPIPILGSFRSSLVRTFSDEVQLQGITLSDNLTWTAGAYYDYTHPVGAQNQNSYVFGGLQALKIPQTVFNSTTGTSARSRAVYAQASYNLGGMAPALNGLSFTGGYRYTWDDRSDFFRGVSGVTGLCTSATPATNCTVSARGSSSAGTWTVGLDYQLDPQTLVYTKGSRGYKGGGFNTAGLDPAHQLFKPEFVKQVEIGLKKDWVFDAVQLRTNVAAFHTSYTDIQKLSFQIVNGNPLIFSDNVATARINGLELSGALIPHPMVELSWSYSYLDAKYTAVVPGSSFSTSLPFYATPKQKFSVGGTIHLPVSSELGEMSLTAAYTHTSDLFVWTERQPGDTIKAYGLVNLSADWDSIGGSPVDLHLFMTNATNTDYEVGTAAYFGALGFSSAVYGEPRMYGFQLRYRWGPDAPSLFH